MDKITAKTGSAPIIKLGHTKGPRFGRDSMAQVKGPKGVTDERAK